MDIGQQFFVSITDSQARTWVNGPMRVNNDSTTPIIAACDHPWLTLPVSFAIWFGFLMLGLLLAGLCALCVLRRRGRHDNIPASKVDDARFYSKDPDHALLDKGRRQQSFFNNIKGCFGITNASKDHNQGGSTQKQKLPTENPPSRRLSKARRSISYRSSALLPDDTSPGLTNLNVAASKGTSTTEPNILLDEASKNKGHGTSEQTVSLLHATGRQEARRDPMFNDMTHVCGYYQKDFF